MIKGNLHVVAIFKPKKAKIIHFEIGLNTNAIHATAAKYIRNFNPIDIETTSTNTWC